MLNHLIKNLIFPHYEYFENESFFHLIAKKFFAGLFFLSHYNQHFQNSFQSFCQKLRQREKNNDTVFKKPLPPFYSKNPLKKISGFFWVVSISAEIGFSCGSETFLAATENWRKIAARNNSPG